MKKINPKNSIMLILSFLIIYSVTSNSSVSNILATNSSNHIPEQLSSKDLVEISPIVIANDDVFESYGFPGDGSEENPYRIENYNITTTDKICISVSGYTTKHFTIQNCFLKTDTNDTIYIGKDKKLEVGSFQIDGNELISTQGSTLKVNGTVEGKIVNNEGFSLDAGIELIEPFVYVKNNTMNGNSAIRLIRTIEAWLVNNTCKDNSEVGIDLIDSNDTVVIGNNCSSNGDTGIRVENCVNVTLKYNYLTENFYGMRIIGSSDSLITNNYFESNTGYGLSMQGSVGLNKIYHNAFVDNNLAGTTIQALDDTGDQWYNEILLEGNFWDDWSPAVSSSYSIDGAAGSEDLYPLGEMPDIPEYTTGYYIFLVIVFSITIPLILYNKKR